MPEGDTVYRLARALDRALAGQTVTSFESVYPALTRINEDMPVVGRTVTGVRSAGKHLLMEFSSGLVLRTHLRMNGRWRLYRQGESRHGLRGAVRIVIGTCEWVAVAFDVQVAEFASAPSLTRRGPVASLGPDLLDASFDESEAAVRLRRQAEADIAEVVLDQRVMAGIGNVFKSEVLFVARVDPFRKVSALADAEVRAVIAAARRLLAMNARQGTAELLPPRVAFRRTTPYADPAARLWVYGRAGRRCRRCGTPIRSCKQGLGARLTFWCPTCQQ
jgi:endonuclease-8